MSSSDFSTLALSPELLTVVQELGFTKMTPIQQKSIPLLLGNKDIIGQSKTGSGKTAAFALPLLEKISHDSGILQGLILCPTRELAAQVVSEIRKLGRRLTGLQVVALTGGQSGREQAQDLEKGAVIAVGTPGRVLDLLQKERLDLSQIQTLILDEADKMLEMGFEDEIRGIFAGLPAKRQTVFFSATFPDEISALSRRYQKNPQRITIDDEIADTSAIEQIVYEEDDKLGALMRVLQQHPTESVLIFCNMKVTVNEIGEALAAQKVSSACLHGDLDQRERSRVMAMFRNGSHRILVATDVAARGLDIDKLEMVVNFDLPLQPEVYVHRIGRTGRAGRSGLAISIAGSKEFMKIHEIEKFTGQKMTAGVLGFKNQHGLGKALRESVMKSFSISGGRKDKLRPGDILGALTGTSGGLKATDIGKIEIQDNFSYVAISAEVADQAFESLRNGRIKGKKFQIKPMK